MDTVGHPQVCIVHFEVIVPLMQFCHMCDREHIIGEEGLWLVAFSGNMTLEQG